VVWVGSSLKDLLKFPDTVQDHMGYALYVAQQGDKHRDAKPLTGFGGAGAVEIVKDLSRRYVPRGVYVIRGPCTCFMPSRKNPRPGAKRRPEISS
jgi:phage-related protein